MPFLDCTNAIQLQGYSKGVTCATFKGIDRLFVNELGNIDTAGSTYDDTAGCLTAYAVSSPFVEIEFDSENTSISWSFTEDNGYYEITVSMSLEGIDKSVRDAVRSWVGKCLVFHAIDRNCVEIVAGLEYNGTAIANPLRAIRVTEHNGTTGVLGGDASSTTITFVGRLKCEPMLANVGAANVPV